MEAQISQQQEKIYEQQDTIENLKKINRELIQKIEESDKQGKQTTLGNFEFLMEEEKLQASIHIQALSKENQVLLDQYNESQEEFKKMQFEKEYLETQYIENEQTLEEIEKALVSL